MFALQIFPEEIDAKLRWVSAGGVIAGRVQQTLRKGLLAYIGASLMLTEGAYACKMEQALGRRLLNNTAGYFIPFRTNEPPVAPASVINKRYKRVHSSAVDATA
jgi:hypothetical protein